MNTEMTKGKDTGAAGIAAQRPFRNICKRMSGADANTRKAVFFSIMKVFSSEDKTEHFLLAHALPIGKFEHPWWGEFENTFESLSKMKSSAERWVAKGGLLSLNFDHDYTRPAGEIVRLEMMPTGLWATAKLTPNAYEKVKSGEYKRFSAEWVPNFKDEKGEKYGDMFYGGALTNIPYFSVSLEGLYLLEDEELLKVAARESRPLLTKEKNRMDPEILTALTGSEDPEKQQETIKAWKADSEVSKKNEASRKKIEEEEQKKTAALTEKDKKIASLQSDLDDISIKVAKMERGKLIADAYREGKLTKVQREAYSEEAEKKNEGDPKKFFAKPFETNEDLIIFLATAPVVIPVPLGTEADLTAETATDADKKSAAKLNMSIEEFARLNKGEISKIKKDKKVKE